MEVKQKVKGASFHSAEVARRNETSAPQKHEEQDLMQAALINPASKEQDDGVARELSRPTPSTILLDDLWPGRSKMQEVIPSLLISNFFAAKNAKELQANKITHVLICASELPEAFPQNFSYMKLSGLTDNTGTQLAPHFEKALPWIKKAINGGGRVLLHCASGSSRSGAILMAYLMWEKNMTVDEALSAAKRSRPVVQPNPGFVEQLKAFEISRKPLAATELDVAR